MTRTFGLQHRPNEPVVLFEYSLDDLRWLIDLISWKDGARRDVQEAIDYLEERKQLKEEQDEEAPTLDIVVIRREE